MLYQLNKLKSRHVYLDCQSKTFNKPKPGEDWGKQIGTCECCDCAIWEKDLNKEGPSRCPQCGFPIE